MKTDLYWKDEEEDDGSDPIGPLVILLLFVIGVVVGFSAWIAPYLGPGVKP